MKKFATKKRIAGVLAIILAFVLAFNLPQYFDSETKAASGTSTSYGLQDNVQDGVILHAWNWSYDTIKANLADIAAAGYTTVQTSPVQQPKDYSSSATTVSSNWWKLYQPISFSIAQSSWLGNASQLQSLCQAADEYGIKIICDIVANHLGNLGGDNNTQKSSLSPQVANYESELYNNAWKYVRGYNDCNDGSVFNVVQGCIGLPDLVTSETFVQNRVISLLKECIDYGVDGFRFDAAKHIETPDDGQYASNFWPNVIGTATSYASSTKGIDLYCYGEILNTVGSGRSISSYTKYIKVTDNKTSDACTANVSWNSATNAVSSYYYTGLTGSNLVLWAESHDTYMGDSGSGGIANTASISQSVINKSWAIVASRAGATALYFARPGSAGMGSMGTTNWKSTEVVAVNKFHNAFAGALEYNSATGSTAVVERYFTSGNCGAVLVNLGGSNSISNVTANKLSNGTYKDHVSGNTFTVSGGKISGQMADCGIAVIYNAEDPAPANTISPAGGTFTTDTISVTLGLTNATSGTYKIGDGGTQTTYTSTTTISVGSGMAYDESVTVYLTASNGTKTTSSSYVFTKADPSKLTTMYFDPSPCSWFANASAVPVVKFDSSGSYQAMSKVTVDDKEYYTIAIPTGAAKVTVARQVPSGEVYNEYTTSLVQGKTLLVSNSDWNSGGSWTTAPVVTIPDTTTETTTSPITDTRKVYFDASPCSWFGTDSAVAVIAVNGSTTFAEMSKTTVNGKTYYYKEIVADATSITIARKTTSGNMYNSKTFTLSSANLLTAYSDWNSGGSWSTLETGEPITDPVTDPVTDPITDTMKIYFSNNQNWSNIYVYSWGSSATNPAWPGTKMTYVKTNQYNEQIYSIEIPKDVKGIIFTNNSGSQTVDITSGITDGLGYYISGTSGSKLTVTSYTYGN